MSDEASPGFVNHSAAQYDNKHQIVDNHFRENHQRSMSGEAAAKAMSLLIERTWSAFGKIDVSARNVVSNFGVRGLVA